MLFSAYQHNMNNIRKYVQCLRQLHLVPLNFIRHQNITQKHEFATQRLTLHYSSFGNLLMMFISMYIYNILDDIFILL